MNEKITDAWITHLGLSENKFPRDVGYPWRRKVNSKEEYIDAIQRKINTSNIYTSIYSDQDVFDSMISEIFIDIDSSVIERSRKDMSKLVKFLNDSFGYVPRVYFTASKGFAIHIDFNPMKIKNIHAVRSWVLNLGVKKDKSGKIIDELGIAYDTTVLGEWRRISRLPYTLNFNAFKKYSVPPRMCVPINPRWSMPKIFGESKKCDMKVGVELNTSQEIRSVLNEYQKDFVEQVDFSFMNGNNGSKKVLKNKKWVCDVLLYLTNNAYRISDGRHRLMTFIVIPAFQKLGMSKEKTFEFLDDFICKSEEGTGKPFRPSLRSRFRVDWEKNMKEDWLPWRPKTFLDKYPELYNVFKRS